MLSIINYIYMLDQLNSLRNLLKEINDTDWMFNQKNFA